MWVAKMVAFICPVIIWAQLPDNFVRREDNYSFTKIGTLIVDNSLLHIAFDLQVSPLQNQMHLINQLFSNYSKLHQIHPNNSNVIHIENTMKAKFDRITRNYAEVMKFYNGTFAADLSNDRVKRSFGFGLAIGLFGTLISGTLFGALSSHQIAQLENAINSQDVKLEKVVKFLNYEFHLVKQQNKSIIRLEQLFNNITSMVNAIDQDLESLVLYSIMDEAVEELSYSLDTFVRIAQSASNHRLSFGKSFII